MSFLRRARRLFTTFTAASAAAAPPSSVYCSGAPRSVPGLDHGRISGNNNQRSRLMLIASRHIAMLLGLYESSVFAEEGSIAENDEAQGSISGLRRIEDGSVVSNTHTVKWRIFTDNGRELFSKGKLDEAEKYFQLALFEAKEGFGERDPHVASSCNNLAELYRVRKAYDKAEPLYVKAISILEESFGSDDIRVGAALHNLAQFYLAQRKFEQARACYERSLKIKGRVLGHGHTDYANTMYHLGTVLYLQGKEKDAETLIRESIRILEEAGQGETMTCIRRMKYLSQILLKSNRPAEAEHLQRKILHIFEISKGWDSIDTVVSAEDLALTLQSLGRLDEALELLERCFDVRKKILPEDHIQIAANMLHLARLAVLHATHQRKAKTSVDCYGIEQAKFLLDNSIRIAKKELECLRGIKTSPENSRKATESEKDATTALLILLQSLDAVGLLELAKLKSEQSKDKSTLSVDTELALRECIGIMKEPGLRNLVLSSPNIRTEYLSCLDRLTSLLYEYANDEAQKSPTLNQLKDEVQQIKSDILHIRR